MKKIKLFDLTIGSEEESIIKKTIRSKYWASGTSSRKVLEFENKFQKYLHTKSCVSVNSGTAALHLALSLFDIKKKEVIVPSLSFVSTAHAIIYNGGIPKFVDVDPKTLCINPLEIEKSITKNTKLILPVHFGGMSCNLESLNKICNNHSLFLVEDAAHAIGAKYKEKKIGIHGDAVCFSFHPTKNLPMPSGGAITLNGKNWKSNEIKVKSRRWCGISNRKDISYDVNELGWNYYMNEFSASIGLIQLKKLDKNNAKRKEIALRYAKEINLELKMPFDKNCSYHFYWIRVKNRKEFMKNMKENGIETGIHYKPIHMFEFYENSQKLKTTDLVGKQIVSLPSHPNLSDSDVDKIIKLTNKFLK